MQKIKKKVNFRLKAQNTIQLLNPETVITMKDILNVRQRTTGTVEQAGQVMLKNGKKVSIRLVDIGGQRSERKKFYFSNIDILPIFISLYDIFHIQNRYLI